MPSQRSDTRVKTPRRTRLLAGPSRVASTGWWPLLFVGPLFLGIATFYLWPIIATAWTSTTTTGPFGGSRQVGGENYVHLVGDSDVIKALGNTGEYVLLVLLGIPLSVGLASLLNRPGLRFSSLYRVFFFLPYVALPTAIAIAWRLMYNGDFGIVNYALSLVGIKGPSWTSTPGVALVAVAIVGIWTSLGFNLIILSAGMRGIPPEIYEAANLDGAGSFRSFFSVTVPLLSPSIFFCVVITTLHGFQLFDLLFAMLGPSNPVTEQTQSLVYLFYHSAFVANNRGYASAIAILILLVIGAATAVQFWGQKKWVTYE